MKGSYVKVQPGKLKNEYWKLLANGIRTQVVPKIMSREAGVFTKKADIKKLIANRLGWTDSASLMKKKITEIEKFGNQAFKDGFKHVVLMGMGGSSLCPEVFKLVFGKHSKLKSYDIIDSTAPKAIKAVERRIDLKKTLFIVASKSGGTVETRSQEAYFIGQLKKAGVRNFGRQMVAITDKGSKLEKFGRKHKYRKIFINPSDIGGRYSALSFFGLVPGFFAGIDLHKFIEYALQMQSILKERDDESNPALVLGAMLATGGLNGTDKLTFLASKKTAPLIPWIEQLVAESTGKKGKGVIPIENEPNGKIENYSRDRLFVFYNTAREKVTVPVALKKAVIRRKSPVIELSYWEREELAAQFLLWEAATAVCGYYLGINPFDEPNVTESKNNTAKILEQYRRVGELPFRSPLTQWPDMSLVAIGGKTKFTLNEINDPVKFLKKYLGRMKKDNYLAVLNYYKQDSQTEKALADIRSIVRDRKKVATIRGYGPRFLHSIGQLYKGGPAKGFYIVLTRDRYENLPIPEQSYDFGRLITAQAIGDTQALIKRHLPVLFINFHKAPSSGLKKLSQLIKKALK